MTRLPPIELFPMTLALYFLIGCWLAFAAIFLLRKRAASEEVRRDQRARLPIAVQGIAFFIIWTIRRHPGDPLITSTMNPYLNIFGYVLALAAVVWVLVSVRKLGKQWTVAARLVKGHKLVTGGPYSLVRNPIYTGIFAMLLATGIILTRWQALLVAIVIFLFATLWRIRVEEDLLRGQFGEEFEEYCKRVPAALLPGL